MRRFAVLQIENSPCCRLTAFPTSNGCRVSVSSVPSDKPEVKIVVEFPQGLTREGENLELTCRAKGKPQ